MRKAVGLSLTILFLFLTLMVLFFFLFSLFGIESNHTVFLGIFSLGISALLLRFLYHFKFDPFKEFSSAENIDFRTLTLFIAVALSLHVCLNPISNLFVILSLTNLETYFVNSNRSVLFIVYTVAIAPVFEEFIFRKFLISKILEYTNLKVLTVFMSSFVFALIHLPSIASLIATFCLGAICGFLYISTKKVLVPIIFHSIYNAIAIVYGNLFLSQYVNFLADVNFGLVYWAIWLAGVIIFALLLKYSLGSNRILKNITLNDDKNQSS